MTEQILKELSALEQERQIKILFACESGSRAWGFASHDSDYDVRLIYVHSRDWYLSLAEQKDVIDVMLPDDLDLSGWDLRKALRLYASCNLALLEWIGSPIVYRADHTFHKAIQAMIPDYFNPRKAMHHYLSMARQSWGDWDEETGTIRCKKLFYALRALAASRWVQLKLTMPPTAFDQMLTDKTIFAPQLTTLIGTYRDQKQNMGEKDRLKIDPLLMDWIEQAFTEGNQQATQVSPGKSPGFGPLDQLFIKYLTDPA